MPKVPTLQAPQVNEQAGPRLRSNVKTSTTNFGDSSKSINALGRAFDKVGDAISKEKKRADDLRVNDALTQYKKWNIESLNNPNNGVLNTKGENAMGAYQQYSGNRSATRDDQLKLLNNDAQKDKFARLADQQNLAYDKQSFSHQSREMNNLMLKNIKASVEVDKVSAVTNWAFPEISKGNIEDQRKTLDAAANDLGYSGKVKDAFITDTVSDTRTGVVSRMISEGSPLMAKQYFTDNKKEFTSGDSDKVSKALEASMLQLNSQEKSAKIVAKHGDNMEAALKEARAIKDPKLEDETVSRVKQQYADNARAEKFSYEKKYETALTEIDSGKSLNDLKKENPGMVAGLKQEELKSLQKAQIRLANNFAPVTEATAYSELTNMSENQKEFANVDMLLYRERLSEGDFKKFMSMAKNARRGGNQRIYDGIQSDLQIVNSVLGRNGIVTGKDASEEDMERSALFHQRMDEAKIQQEEIRGKKLNNNEIREIAEDMMTDIIVGKQYFFFDDTKKSFELSEDEVFDVAAKEGVPPEDVAEIVAALKRNGKPVTIDKIVNAFSTMQGIRSRSTARSFRGK